MLVTLCVYHIVNITPIPFHIMLKRRAIIKRKKIKKIKMNNNKNKKRNKKKTMTSMIYVSCIFNYFYLSSNLFIVFPIQIYVSPISSFLLFIIIVLALLPIRLIISIGLFSNSWRWHL